MKLRLSLSILALAALAGCAHRSPYATTDDTLALDRVVLYRSGIGYFERSGSFDGDELTLKVRKDQVNDLLKSLTVVDKGSGQVLSVSMPLDPQSWANAALALLTPGSGELAAVLDALRGAEVTFQAGRRRVRGRIVMVEEVEDEPPGPQPISSGAAVMPMGSTRDHKITVLRGRELEVVRLSQVRGFTLHDGALALQLHRSLDAGAGEGMFQQVAVKIRLGGAKRHDLLISYVVAAPVWKPTYRVVLPEDTKGEALLQAWAVVDNVSGEDWRAVGMSLTAGEPIAFRYDLHTPRMIERADLSAAGTRKRATVALGESSYGAEAAPAELYAEEESAAEPMEDYDDVVSRGDMKEMSKKKKDKSPAKPAPARASASSSTRPMGGAAPGGPMPIAPPPPPQLDRESLARSVAADAKARSVSGLTSYDLGSRVTVPDGTSTMVALVNAQVEAEQTFLFRPGGAGVGYEVNPYRVVRVRNSTPFVLEPGPITIYAGGSFVGEGISEAVGAGSSATIPFAVEPSIMVTSQAEYTGAELRVVRIVRGVLECESFQRRSTTWSVKGKPDPKGYRVLVRHTRAGQDYALQTKPEGVEELPDGYLIPVKVDPKSGEGSVKVVEQTPSRMSLSIWDGRSPALVQALLSLPNLDPAARAKLQPIVDARQEIGRIDTELDGLRAQQVELDARAEETRQNLEAIKKDPKANDLRLRLSKRLEEFTSAGDKIGRTLVELQSKRLERRIALEDLMQSLDLTAPPPR